MAHHVGGRWTVLLAVAVLAAGCSSLMDCEEVDFTLPSQEAFGYVNAVVVADSLSLGERYGVGRARVPHLLATVVVRDVAYLDPELVSRVGDATRIAPGELTVDNGDCTGPADMRSVGAGRTVVLFLIWDGGAADGATSPDGQKAPWSVLAVAELLDAGELDFVGLGVIIYLEQIVAQQGGTPFEALVSWIAESREAGAG